MTRTHDERYEAVLAAVGGAMAEAGALGWQGYEAQAHIFLAMFDAAEGRDHIPAPEPEPEPDPETAAHNQIEPAAESPGDEQ